MANHTIRTRHKPITKGWTDARLAGPKDIKVLVGGQPVEIASVNALEGEIILQESVPSGSKVEVSYYYFRGGDPFVGNFPSFGEFGYTQFAESPQQFWQGTETNNNITLLSSSPELPQPALIGHVHTAFQRSYTASMNDPTTLLFNEVTGGFRGMGRKLSPTYIIFEGEDYPEEPTWRVSGKSLAEMGPATFEEGLFVIEDDSSSKDVVSSDPKFYSATADFSYAYSLTLNFRSKIFEYQKDGDFTGIAVGFAGGKSLHFLGFLEKDGFKFAGFLGLGGDETQWQSYHGIRAILGSDSKTLTFEELTPLRVGQRIKTSSGEIREIILVEGLKVLVDLPFQEEVMGTNIEVFPEIDFGELTSFRIYREAGTGVTKAFSKGRVAPFAVIRAQDRPQSPEIFELLYANEIFFGSLSRRATNRSGWDFFRSSVLPQNPSQQSMEVSVNTPFTSLPQEILDPEQVWTQTDNQGYALIEPASQKVVIQQAGRDSRGGFSYHRIEPFLDDQSIITLEAGWRIFHAGEGMPWHLTISDGRKEVTLCLFSVQESGATSTPLPPNEEGGISSQGLSMVTGGQVPGDSGTTLITTGILGGETQEEPQGSVPTTVGQGAGILATKGQMPGDEGVPLSTKGQVEGFYDFTRGLVSRDFRMNYPGVRPFEEEGWNQSFGPDIQTSFIDHALHIKRVSPTTQESKATKVVKFPPDNVPVSNYVTSFRLRINEIDPDSLSLRIDDGLEDIRIIFGKTSTGQACLRFLDENQNDYVRDSSGDIQELTFHWDDGLYHAYRIRRHNTLLSIFIDGAFKGWFDLSLFPSSQRIGSAQVGIYLGPGELDLDLDFWFLHSNEYGKRWVGLYDGSGHLYDPDSYEMVEYDWLNKDFAVRVSRNPTGKTVIEFGNESFEKQYHELPDTLDRALVNSPLGYVCFGAMQPGTHAYARCDYLNYVIRNQPERRRKIPNSVFNWAWPVTSPEYVYDEDPERFPLKVSEGNKINLSSYGIKARRVLSVEKGGELLEYSFDSQKNEIILEHVPSQKAKRPIVNVTLIHGRPFGKRYLRAQQVPHIKLNEGTPTFWSSQRKKLQVDKRLLTDPDVEWADSITLEDGQYKVTFRAGPDNFYESLEIDSELFSGQQKQNLLFPACDDGGWVVLDPWSPGDLIDRYELPPQKDYLCEDLAVPFLLDKGSHTLDGPSSVLDQDTSTCDIQLGFGWVIEEKVGSAEETFKPGVITLYDGLILDSFVKGLDKEEDMLDVFEPNPEQSLDFETPFEP